MYVSVLILLKNIAKFKKNACKLSPLSLKNCRQEGKHIVYILFY